MICDRCDSSALPKYTTESLLRKMRVTLRSPSKMHFLHSFRPADWTLMEQIKLPTDYPLANHTMMCFFPASLASLSIHALTITSPAAHLSHFLKMFYPALSLQPQSSSDSSVDTSGQVSI